MRRWLRKKDDNPLAEAYRVSLDSLSFKKAHAEHGSVLVIDTETSGFQIGKDRILSAAGIIIEEGAMQLGSSKAWLVRQEGVEVTESSPVHGLVPSEIEGGISEEAFLEEFLPMLHGRVVVGHHALFDVRMLDEAMRRIYGLKWRNPYIDTAMMAANELHAFHRTGYANQPMPSLDDVCSELSLYPMERHSAWGDAFTTAEIYLLICARMRQRLKRPVEFRDLPLGKR